MRFPLLLSLLSPPLLHLSFPSPPVGPASSWKPVFREQRNFFSVRNYYREFHGRMFVSRISFPLHRPVGHSTRVHSYSSVFQLLSESSFSSSSSSSSLSLSLFFERDSSFRFRIHRPSKRRASGAIEWKKLYPRKSPSFYRILRNASLFPIVSLLFFQTAQLFAIIHRVSKLCTVKSTSVTRYFKRCFTTMIKENSLILGLLDDENSKKRLNFQLCSRLFNFNFFGEKKIFYCKFWGIIVKRKNSNFRI